MSVSREIEGRKERWSHFLDDRRPDRHLFIINYRPDAVARPPLWPDRQQERVDWAWEQYERAVARSAWLADDNLPYLDMLTGTEIFAEAFGCKVHRPADNNPFALPLVHNAAEAARVKPVDLASSSLAGLFEMADRLRDRAGPGALLRLVDIQSPMDIVALIWDKNDFYLALLEEPEAVKTLSAMVYDLLTAFLDTWFSRYGRDFIAHYPTYYMPRGISVSEDEVGVVSPAMFREFFYPELAALSRRYGGLGLHCCANARHQWAGFREIPGLRLINLVQPEPVIRASWPYFARQAVQWPSWIGAGDPATWPEQVPADCRMVFEIPAETHEQAVRLSEQLCRPCRRHDENIGGQS